jgi:hypothetical protein
MLDSSCQLMLWLQPQHWHQAATAASESPAVMSSSQ